HVVESGIDALRFLRGEDPFGKAPRPDLVLLDLHLPKMSGRELLMHIRGDVYLRTIPVVVLSTSDVDEEVYRTYANFASSYIVKPIDMHEFASMMRSL